MPRVARNFRFFADQLLALGRPAPRTTRVRRTGRLGPERRHGRDHAVERPADARDLAGGARARRRQRGDSEAAGVGAAHRLDAGRHRARGRAPGAFNVVQGARRGSRRRPHRAPRVDRIAFTGSVQTGTLVAQAAGANLTPVSLELGGKSPFVAFADADLDAVVAQAVNQFDNAGQVYLAGTRLIVERSMHEAFLERFVDAAAEIVQGDPRDEPPTSDR